MNSYIINEAHRKKVDISQKLPPSSSPSIKQMLIITQCSYNAEISGLEVTLDQLGPTCSQKRKRVQRCLK